MRVSRNSKYIERQPRSKQDLSSAALVGDVFPQNGVDGCLVAAPAAARLEPGHDVGIKPDRLTGCFAGGDYIRPKPMN